MAANEVINAEDLHRDVSFHSQLTNNILLNRSGEADFHRPSSSVMPLKKPFPIDRRHEEIVDLEQRRVDSTT